MNGEDVTGIYEKNTATDHVLARSHDEPSSMKHYTFPDSKPFPTDDCNVIPHNPPGNNEYSIEEHRLRTFSDRLWPLGLKQKPEELAKAGFYYLGKYLSMRGYLYIYNCLPFRWHKVSRED